MLPPPAKELTRLLRQHGEEPTDIIRITSPGDSCAGAEEILFLSADGPKIAYVYPRENGRRRRIEVEEGWRV